MDHRIVFKPLMPLGEEEEEAAAAVVTVAVLRCTRSRHNYTLHKIYELFLYYGGLV